MIITVKVKPGARREEVKEISRDYLEVRVNAPPEKGKANERVLELIARHYGVRKSSVRILKGERAREKLIEIDL
ncbi:hypothetical protein BCF55_0136 [Hydrogenivirga caldilitoris]|uniref:UPF0235 protein BCF55_0136 n=1 Tax=Hydrogenivirga caldilitoris TaxID=246264 RepID=A0A497XP31_9AQUI|nr:DUF167 domain-containing protein [Hydrogenivirga caldilitoris]RLJ69879.1 hypothetical protein BCF55_0136 [Hydrogenivirga caldilitoris]